jgi:DNA-binding response OmpR family regulator
VIILTARGEEDDRVQGLRLGADDYVVKPFSVKELLARVEAVLRRSPNGVEDLTQVAFAGGAADLAAREVRFDNGESVDLSDRELELLRYLAGNAGRPVTREELLARVWGINAQGFETRTIDVHVARLREKLRDDSANPRIIVTVRGKGYRFETT